MNEEQTSTINYSSLNISFGYTFHEPIGYVSGSDDWQIIVDAINKLADEVQKLKEKA